MHAVKSVTFTLVICIITSGDLVEGIGEPPIFQGEMHAVIELIMSH